MASAVPTVGIMGGPDHCVRFDGCGVLHGHCPIVLINNPPPPRVFKLASVSFALLAEVLFLK